VCSGRHGLKIVVSAAVPGRKTQAVKRIVLIAAALVLAACHREGFADAGVADAGPAANVDAGPPPLPELTITLQYARTPVAMSDAGTPLPDAGAGTDAGTQLEAVQLMPGERSAIPPVQALTIVVNRGLRNARLRVLDEADRVVASDETLDERPDSIRDELHFEAPLEPGHRYVLVLDAENGAQILDERGQPILGRRREFATTGERPPPVKKAPPAKKRHRRRH
jgi:hypothetical protein